MEYRIVKIDKDVFRAYDIRGLVEKQLTPDAYYTLGLAIGLELASLGGEHLFLARDGRLTGPALSQALCAGLRAVGRHVMDLGAVSTPMLYFSTHTGVCDSGVIVTGSHNPSEYNGIKMVLAGKTLVQEDIERLYHRVEALQTNAPAAVEQGAYSVYPVADAYRARILSDVKLHRPMKVVVDCGNGIGGMIVPSVLEALGCEVIPLYCDVDGRFPNHHPDPTVEANMEDCKAAVLKHKADIGLGFDGDADRLGIVTEKGEIIWPDRLMMFYVKDVLKRHPGGTIVYDVKCSKALKQIIEACGGIARMCPTGHSIVKGVMKAVKAPLAGEMSGHLFFKDRWFGFDDALYSACRLLEQLSASSQKVSEQFDAIPNPISTAEIKIPVTEAEKFEVMRRFIEEVNFNDAERITIDGIRLEFEQGWGLLRASNTTPCLVARFEGDNLEALQAIQAKFKGALNQLNQNLVLPF